MKSNTGVPNNSSEAACKQKSKYLASLRKLQAHAEHQEQLIQQAKNSNTMEQELHRVLADGICQQKCLYELLKPLHHQWMQQPEAEDCASSQWLRSCAEGDVRPPGSGWDTLVSLVASCNNMLAAMLQATPQQVQEVMTITADQLCDVHSALFVELLVLLEMVSPQRYHGNEPPVLHATHTQAVGDMSAEVQGSGSEGADPVIPNTEAEARAAGEAVEAAEKRLEELLMQSRTMGGLLVLHRPTLLMGMCTINIATRQPSVAPMGHFVKAAERLKLSSEQLTQLRLMLHQYNRGMQVQLQQGLELLQMSKKSTSLQAAAVSARADGSRDTSDGVGWQQAASASTAAGATTASAQEASKRAGSVHAPCSTSRQRQEQERMQLHGQQRGQVDGGEEEEDDVAADSLAEQMQQHLSDRMQLMQLMGFWVGNSLRTIQFAQFLVYSYPFYPQCPTLAEAATLLPAPDGPALPEVDAFMQKLRAGMQLEFEWLLQHTPELAEQCMAEGDTGGNDG